MKAAKTLPLLALMLIVIALSGCATIGTLNQPAHEKKPLVMSGTRLNLASLRNEPLLENRFGVRPPSYPLLDLPFSTLFDMFALSYTVPVALLHKL